jgi:hypothetical protein
MSLTQEQKNQFFANKDKERFVIKGFGKKLSFSNFPQDVKEEVLNRLADKDEFLARGLKGELPGLMIDGKQVTRENIKEFEVAPKKEKKVKKEKVYIKEDLEELDFKELKKIGKKFGTTDRSRKNLIKEILSLQKEVK